MKKTLCIATVVAILATVLLSGCSSESKVFPEVLGTWELIYSNIALPTFSPSKRSYKKGSEYYEFKNNGTALVPVTADENGNARSVECTLTATEREMTIDYNGIALISGKYSLNGKKLTVTNDSTGNTFIFVKQD